MPFANAQNALQTLSSSLGRASIVVRLVSLPITDSAVHAREETQALIDEGRNEGFDLVDILHHMFYALLVKG